MRACLFIIAGLGALYGVTAFGNAQSAVHEIEGLISFLIATVSFGLGGVIQAQVDARKPPKPPKPPPAPKT